MTAPEKDEQDPQACLVKVAGGALLPWKPMQALVHTCDLGKSRYMQWGASAIYSRGKSKGRMGHGGNRQSSGTSNHCTISSGV